MNFTQVMGLYEELINERSDFEAEWRDISDYLIPGRGINQTFYKPRKRVFTSKRTVNTSSREAMGVLTAELHSRLTSPARPWFKLEWDSPEAAAIEFLNWWMQDSEDRVYDEFTESNFYSSVLSFYDDLVGFGIGSMYVGDGDKDVAFRFEPITVGEYAISLNSKGIVDLLMRTIFMTPRQMLEKFGEDKVSPQVKDAALRIDKETNYVTVIEYVRPGLSGDKKYIQDYYEYGFSGASNVFRYYEIENVKDRKSLKTRGFYEFPYPTCRWATLGADVYGTGPGSKALPDIKRLQEMEKAFMLAIHKSADPPTYAPSRLKGRLNTLPGGTNYYTNPNEVVTNLYQMTFDYKGVAAAVERVEMRIGKTFYNDIFFSAMRDPNATPYKATEVNAREREKMTRLGPVIERLQHEFFLPLIERCFSMLLRKGKLAPIPDEFVNLISDYNIRMISPLAQAQRLVAVEGIQQFLMFIGQTAQFDPTIVDNVDGDKITNEMAEITGQSAKVLRTADEVKQIRDQRAEQQKQQQDMQMQMMQKQQQMEEQESMASTAKDRADATKTIAEVQGNA